MVFYRVLVCCAIAVICVVSINGCAWLVKPPQDQAVARQCVEDWLSQNTALTQFKGMMRIQMQSQDGRLNSRAAFVAAIPDRLRVELLNPIGQPLSSFASDGEAISILSAPHQRFYSLKQTPTALKRLIHVPIGVRDFIDILCGRPSLPEFYAAQIASTPSKVCNVNLINRWNTQVADLRSGATHQIEQMRIYDRDGTLQYQVQWDRWQNWDQYLLPGKISVMTGQGDQVTIELDRLWTDVTLDPAIFVLGPQKK